MNWIIKRALYKIGSGLIMGVLAFAFLYLADTDIFSWSQVGYLVSGGLLFVLSARQVALGISHLNNI